MHKKTGSSILFVLNSVAKVILLSKTQIKNDIFFELSGKNYLCVGFWECFGAFYQRRKSWKRLSGMHICSECFFLVPL